MEDDNKTIEHGQSGTYGNPVITEDFVEYTGGGDNGESNFLLTIKEYEALGKPNTIKVKTLVLTEE